MENVKVVGLFLPGRLARGCESDRVADDARSSDHERYVHLSGEAPAVDVEEARWGFCGQRGAEVFRWGGWGEGGCCLSGA